MVSLLYKEPGAIYPSHVMHYHLVGIKKKFDTMKKQDRDSWDMIVLHRQNHKSTMERLRSRQKQRKMLLRDNEHSSTPSPSAANKEEDIITTQLVDPVIESKLLSLLAESLTLVPLQLEALLKKLQMRLTDNKASISDVHVILEKFSAQNLITLEASSNDVNYISSKVVDIASMMDEELKLAEESKEEYKSDKEARQCNEENRVGARRKRTGEIPLETKKPKLQVIEELLKIPSVREAANRKVSEEVQELLNASTTMEQMNLNKFKSQGISKVREFCTNGTREECRRANRSSKACNKLHFIRVIQKHTDKSLGDCSFLNTCFHTETCKYVHYKVDEIYDDREEENKARELKKKDATIKPIHGLQTKIVPAQWICCDLRYLDLKVLGKFSVIMADPPWDIHMELPYGTMSDDEMRKLPIPSLQDDGFIFLWVTGRAMELGRECLAVWGYERVDEVVWVKTNQLQRLIRTGRTGHWINHGKEHCLVGAKGNVDKFNRGVDCDVVVTEVRDTSHKPDEIYGIIERLAPGMKKVELFGRQHNVQPNWVTLGNQLDGVNLVDEEVKRNFYAKYPDGNAMQPQSVTVPPGGIIPMI